MDPTEILARSHSAQRESTRLIARAKLAVEASERLLRESEVARTPGMTISSSVEASGASSDAKLE